MESANFLAYDAQHPAFAKFTLTCNDKQWRVNELIVGFWSESLAQPRGAGSGVPEPGKHDLSRYELQHVDALVEFLCKTDYDTEGVGADGEEMCFHVHMCVIAQEYGISRLRDFASNKFSFALSDVTNASALNARDLFEVTQLAYANEPATVTIRKDIVHELIERKIFHPESQDRHVLDATSNTFPQFANDVFRAQIGWDHKKIQKLQQELDEEKEKCRSASTDMYFCPNPNAGSRHRGTNLFRRGIPSDDEQYEYTHCKWRETGKKWNASYRVAEEKTRSTREIRSS